MLELQKILLISSIPLWESSFGGGGGFGIGIGIQTQKHACPYIWPVWPQRSGWPSVVPGSVSTFCL